MLRCSLTLWIATLTILWCRQARKESPIDTIGFFYDQQRLLMELDASGDTDHFYTSTTDEHGDLLSEYDGADSDYHTYDALGSTDALLDDSQSATDRAMRTAPSARSSSKTPNARVGAV